LHSTQRLLSPQSGAPASAGQSVFTTHCTQRSRGVAQIGVEVPAQSGLATHSTHAPVLTLHFGVSPPHCVSAVHTVVHLCSRRSHALPAPQSALTRHATQVKSPRKQRGAEAGQSVFCAHATHVFDVGSQSGRVAGQSLACWQPTHAPVVASQSGVSPLQVVWPASARQDG